MSQFSKPKRICTGFQFLEGPVWVEPDSPLLCGLGIASGSLIFSDIPADRLYWLSEGYCGIAREPSGHSNGNALDTSGRLVSCEHGTRCVSRFDGRKPATPVARRYRGKRFNSPNDVAVRSDGAVFFTDPPYGISDDLRELEFQGVYCVLNDADEPILLVGDFEKPNGLAFSADETFLYIADTERGHLRRFAVSADGTLSDEKIFCDCKRPDGISCDTAGNIWVACLDGVNIFDSGGNWLDAIRLPERPANLAFGGRLRNILYICAGTSIYAAKTRSIGAL